MNVMDNWFNRIQYIVGVFASATIVLGVMWQYMIKPTLAYEFATLRQVDAVEERLIEECVNLGAADQAIGQKIDRLHDKIDDIYKLLIKTN